MSARSPTASEKKSAHIEAVCRFYGNKKIKDDEKLKSYLPANFFNLLVSHQEKIFEERDFYQKHVYRKVTLSINYEHGSVLLSEVSIDETVSTIKKRIEKITGAVPTALSINGYLLKDYYTLADCGFREGSSKKISATYEPQRKKSI